MATCRDIGKLVPELQEKVKLFLLECEKENIQVLIVETFRSAEVQSAYYIQGRADLKSVNDKRIKAGLTVITEKENVIITQTKSGFSKHNLGKAFDVVPLVKGKPCWIDSVLFAKIGVIGKRVGFKWGGDFKSIKDCPHFEI